MVERAGMPEEATYTERTPRQHFGEQHQQGSSTRKAAEEEQAWTQGLSTSASCSSGFGNGTNAAACVLGKLRKGDPFTEERRHSSILLSTRMHGLKFKSSQRLPNDSLTNQASMRTGDSSQQSCATLSMGWRHLAEGADELNVRPGRPRAVHHVRLDPLLVEVGQEGEHITEPPIRIDGHSALVLLSTHSGYLSRQQGCARRKCVQMRV
eukprot:6087772-Pleurochrysis_carterae.AAC.3